MFLHLNVRLSVCQQDNWKSRRIMMIFFLGGGMWYVTNNSWLEILVVFLSHDVDTRVFTRIFFTIAGCVFLFLFISFSLLYFLLVQLHCVCVLLLLFYYCCSVPINEIQWNKIAANQRVLLNSEVMYEFFLNFLTSGMSPLKKPFDCGGDPDRDSVSCENLARPAALAEFRSLLLLVMNYQASTVSYSRYKTLTYRIHYLSLFYLPVLQCCFFSMAISHVHF